MEGIKWFAIIFGITTVTNAIFGLIGGLWGIISIVPRAILALTALGAAMGRGIGNFIYSNPLTQGLLNIMTKPTGAAAAGLSGLGKAGGKAVGGAIAQQAGKRLAGAGASLLIPGLGELIGLGLTAWAIWDIVKLAKNWVGSQNVLPASTFNPSTKSETYDWNSTLTSMTVNARNVYIKADNVYGHSNYSGNSDTSSFTEDNVARSLYDMEKW